jgi:lysophospholipase L1-like esterase
VALRAAGEDGSAIQAGTDRALAFGGKAGITIPPGAAVLSDPVALDTPALADLAVSLYLPGKTGATSLHGGANQVGYVSKPGDFSGADLLPTQRNIGSWPFLTEVDVDGDGATIVTLGDSITDGANSTRNRNERWPDRLAQRLQAAHMPLGVVNRGISGNRLLVNPDEGSLSGRSILERFDRDVLAAPGVRYMTLMIGINDIGHRSATEPLSADDLIAGYRQVIARAHAHGIQVFGATLTPFEGAKYYSPEKEALRQAVNTFVRSSREFDGVIDFDRVTRDPANPGRFLPAYDSGDHLHPGDKGYEAMGDAVPLEWFKK